jgi:hypothetical protein
MGIEQLAALVNQLPSATARLLRWAL